MKLTQLIRHFPSEQRMTNHFRPYVNHSVEFKKIFTRQERARVLEEVGLNVFFFPAEMVTGCDLLSDSGTTTMTNEQWAALHFGDEAYGSNRGYFLLLDRIRETFGEGFATTLNAAKPNIFLFHQGRSAEDALFTILGKLGLDQIIPSNGHFDTTAANIKVNNIKAVNLFPPELEDDHSASHFKGNMDVTRLETLLKSSNSRIPLVYLTITNNSGGGQPVSLKNIKVVANLSHEFSIPLFFDACRFAENAWFIKQYEPGYQNKSIKQIVKEMFSYVDGFTISFKKDGLANMGGGLFLKNNGLLIHKYPKIPEALMNFQIRTEGHPTYGGMSGRDIITIVMGLPIVTKEEYLTYRINQVQDFGQEMSKRGIPVLLPIGGHAVYLDMNKFFRGTNMKPADFGGIAFTAVLLAAYGHRACELGNFAFGSYNPVTNKETFPEMNFIRFAVPRLRYEKQDLDSVVTAVETLYEHRQEIPKIKVAYGKDLPLRHFKAKFTFN